MLALVRARWKQMLIGLAAVVLLAVAAGFLLRAVNGGRFRGGEDTDYPFTWTERRDGSVRLALPRAAGRVWTADEADAALLTVTGQGEGQFLVVPAAEGAQVLSFTLRGEADGRDKAFRWSLRVACESDGGALRAHVSSYEGTPLQGLLTGAADEAGRAAYTIDPFAGGLTIDAADASDEPYWTGGSSDESVLRFAEAVYDTGLQEATGVFFAGGAAGTCEIFFHSGRAGTEIAATVENDGNGGLTVTAHERRDYTAAAGEEPRGEAAERADYLALFGEPALPDGAADVRYELVSLRDEARDAGVVGFTLDGRRWSLLTTEAATADELLADWAEEDVETTSEEVNGRTVTLQLGAGAAQALWTDGEGKLNSLSCFDGAEKLERDVPLALARQLISVEEETP